MHLKSEPSIIIAKRLRTAKTVLWGFFFNNKNVVIKTLKKHYEINCPKPGMKYFQLLLVNAPAHSKPAL